MSALQRQLARAATYASGGALPAAPPAASGAENHNGDALENVLGNRLATKSSEQFAIGEVVAGTGRANPAAINAVGESGSEQSGTDRHVASESVNRNVGVAGDSESVQRFRIRQQRARQAFVSWCVRQPLAIDDESPPDLPSLLTCEDVCATCLVDPAHFIEEAYDVDEIARVRALLSRPGRERALKAWEEHEARKPQLSLEDRMHVLSELTRCSVLEDAGSCIQILEDRTRRFAGGDPGEYARQVAATLPDGWSEGVVVALAQNQHPVICRRTDDRVTLVETRTWIASLPRIDGAPRFKALSEFCFEGYARHLIPRSSSPSLAELEAPLRSTPVRILPTGIAPLDRLLSRTGGLSEGARVMINASTGEGKTTLALESAEAMASNGVRVAWVATGDDGPDAIRARLRQRRGMTQEDALASTDMTGLPPIRFFDGRKTTLEAVLLHADEIDVFFVDPLTKALTECASKDPVALVGYSLALLEAAGVTVVFTAPNVRGSRRRDRTERAYGGQAMEGSAMLLLEPERDKKTNMVTIHIGKSRFGGEDQEFRLQLDPDRSALRPLAAAAPPLSAEERVWRDVQTALAEGSLTARTLAEGKVKGRAATIRTIVKAKLASGELVEVDGKVGLR
jgi:hypothetical protein